MRCETLCSIHCCTRPARPASYFCTSTKGPMPIYATPPQTMTLLRTRSSGPGSFP